MHVILYVGGLSNSQIVVIVVGSLISVRLVTLIFIILSCLCCKACPCYYKKCRTDAGSTQGDLQAIIMLPTASTDTTNHQPCAPLAYKHISYHYQAVGRHMKVVWPIFSMHCTIATCDTPMVHEATLKSHLPQSTVDAHLQLNALPGCSYLPRILHHLFTVLDLATLIIYMCMVRYLL